MRIFRFPEEVVGPEAKPLTQANARIRFGRRLLNNVPREINRLILRGSHGLPSGYREFVKKVNLESRIHRNSACDRYHTGRLIIIDENGAPKGAV